MPITRAPPAVARWSARKGSRLAPLQLAGPVGLAERVEHGEGRAGADIGADAEPDAVTIGLSQIEQARAEEHVAGRAEGDAGARLGHARQRPVAHMDAMGEDRARPDQAEAVVDVEIVGGLGEALGDERDLARIFGEVGVHQHVRDARRPALPASASCSALEVGTKRGVTA